MKPRANSLNGEDSVKTLKSEKVVYASNATTFKSMLGLLGNDTVIKPTKMVESKDESKPVSRARSQSAATELKDVNAKTISKPTFHQFVKGIFGLANDQSAEQQASIIPTNQGGIN